MDSVFAQFENKVWHNKYAGQLWISHLAGGTPNNPRVIEGHIKSKMQGSEEMIQEAIAETMVARGVTADEAADIVAASKNLNGFKRDPDLGMFIEGRQLKAAIKEAISVAVAAGTIPQRGWGFTKKSIHGFAAEHVVVDDDRLYISRDGAPMFEEDEIIQRFVHTWRGTGIQYEEVCHGVYVNFTVLTDTDEFEAKDFWPLVWVTGQNQGIGASRSQGFGRYKVTQWDKVVVGSNGAKVTGGNAAAVRATRTSPRKVAAAH